jgi:hypothetical protein
MRINTIWTHTLHAKFTYLIKNITVNNENNLSLADANI